MKRLLLTAGLALPALLFAQAPSGVSLDRDRLLVGDTVTVVVNFEAATRWCGLRVDFGDGDIRDEKVEDFPVTLTKQYASAGRYVVRATGRAVPRGLLSVLPCTGRPRTAALEVVQARRDEPPAPRRDDGVEPKEIEKKERERQRRAEKREREEQTQERRREQKSEREREQRDQRERERRERAERAVEASRRPPAREAEAVAGPAPVPARPRAPAPAPAASKPRDGSLKVF